MTIGGQMSSLLVPVLIALLVAAAVLHVMRSHRVAAWLLVTFPAALCAGIVLDLSKGAAALGQGAFEGDQKQLVYCFFFLALSLTAALCPKWPWLFRLAWVIDASVCGILVYLAYFWKVFN